MNYDNQNDYDSDTSVPDSQEHVTNEVDSDENLDTNDVDSDKILNLGAVSLPVPNDNLYSSIIKLDNDNGKW